MDADSLPNDIEQLKALLLQTQAELDLKESALALNEQVNVELTATVGDQQQTLSLIHI